MSTIPEDEHGNFKCPKCGGQFFGRDTGEVDGTIQGLDTVHCNGNSSLKPHRKCEWTGVWIDPVMRRYKEAAT